MKTLSPSAIMSRISALRSGNERPVNSLAIFAPARPLGMLGIADCELSKSGAKYLSSSSNARRFHASWILRTTSLFASDISLLLDEGHKARFVQDLHLQLLRLVELRSRARPCDHVVGLRAHARGRLPPELAHQRLRIRPAHRLNGPGEDKGPACERPLARRLHRLRLHAR